MPACWLINDQVHDLTVRGWIMGVLNVTPDSFSDGGKFPDAQLAADHALKMLADGADVIDIGGGSTRPGAQSVPLDVELQRVLPVIKSLRQQTGALISIDTMKPEVARAALDAGADIINDVSGLRDPRMIEVAAQNRAGIIVMHMQGTPGTMQASPHYENVVVEVRAFFEERLRTLDAAGIGPQRIALDPGIGFGKTLPHNLELLRNMHHLKVEDRPLVVGVSRKSLIARLLGQDDMNLRFWPAVALTAWLRDAGAHVLRVHDVKPNAQALRMVEAINSCPEK
ncbi:MAG: dihydropteroate synthase [Verrucomicrobiaceae bacterium]